MHWCKREACSLPLPAPEVGSGVPSCRQPPMFPAAAGLIPDPLATKPIDARVALPLPPMLPEPTKVLGRDLPAELPPCAVKLPIEPLPAVEGAHGAAAGCSRPRSLGRAADCGA